MAANQQGVGFHTQSTSTALHLRKKVKITGFLNPPPPNPADHPSRKNIFLEQQKYFQRSSTFPCPPERQFGFTVHQMLEILLKKKAEAFVVGLHCTAALRSVMATAKPAWNASVLLGMRKGCLCFLCITVTQTRSFKLFCSLFGLHKSLPNLHNNKRRKGGNGAGKSTCSWTSGS